jgi:alpha-ribazole phosphatase
MKKIILIRHTTPSIEPGVCYGITDLKPSSSYTDELIDIKMRLGKFKPEIIYSSPLIRCHKLANDLFNTKIETDKRLCELNFGHWEMKKWNEIPLNSIDEWTSNLFDFKVPGGESFKDLYNRVKFFWEQNITSNKHNHIAITTHSGVIRALLMEFLDISPEKIFNLELSYGTLVEIEYQSNQHTKVRFL